MTENPDTRSQSTPASFAHRLFPHLALAAALAASALLGACSSTASTQDSQQPRADSDRAAPIDSDEFKINHEGWSEMGYEWRWTGYPPLQPGAVIDHATAYDDVIVFQGSASTLSVLEANTGKVRWSRQVDRPTTVFQESVRRGDTLYTASDTELWEIDLKNGNTLDRDSLGSLVNTTPLVTDNLAIFGTLAGELFAFQMDNDFKLWSYKFDGPIHVPAIQIDDKYIAALSEKGDLRTLEAINAHSGMTVRIAGGSDADLLTDHIGIYIASKDQSLYAFDAQDGFRFWRVRSSAPVTVQHTLYQGVVYATTDDTGLAAIDAATGKAIWKNDAIGGWVVTVIDESRLVVWSGYELITVDRERGDILSRMALGGVAGIRTDSIDDGNLYVVTLEGSVARFSPR